MTYRNDHPDDPHVGQLDLATSADLDDLEDAVIDALADAWEEAAHDFEEAMWDLAEVYGNAYIWLLERGLIDPLF